MRLLVALAKGHVSSFSVALILSSLVACGPKDGPEQSQLDTVGVPQTDVRNQRSVGFCWAYATAGLLESQYKLNTGKDIHLSPDALGFYRMVEGLYQMTREHKADEILKALKTDDLQGYFVSAEDQKPYDDALGLLKVYGIVPASEFSYPFDSSEKIDLTVLALKANLAKLVWTQLLHGKDASGITRDDLIQHVLVGNGAYISSPPTTVVDPATGLSVSPVDFMRKTLGFQPENFGFVDANSLSDMPKLVGAIKRSLLRGVDPVLSFPVKFDRLRANAFIGAGVDVMNSANFTGDGGHAVLITDFVNQGSKAGALSPAEIATEFHRSADDLNQVIIKNSWGMKASYNDKGEVVSGSVNGYYTMDRDYMRGAANAGWLQVVVPSDIAANPTGDEPVNPKVAIAQ